jgi:glucokinase
MDKFLCGVDIGGTKLSAGLIYPDGRILDKITLYDHTGKTEDQVVDQIASTVKQLLSSNGMKESDLEGIGVGFPGHVRYRDGVTITTSNLKGFKGYPLRDNLRKNFSVQVRLDNDANAQAYCELRYGAGRGFSDLIFLTISTGIGAGIILDRKIYRGITGTAGEFGHTIVDPRSDLVCTCGNKGCLMGCACGLALPHHFRNRIEQGMKTTVQLPEDFTYDKVDGQMICRGVAAGDPLCTSIVLECADYIGIGVYNIFQVFNPPIVILGGGLCNFGDIYLKRIKEKFYELARDMIFDPIEIVESEAGSDAGLIGAAALVLE